MRFKRLGVLALAFMLSISLTACDLLEDEETTISSRPSDEKVDKPSENHKGPKGVLSHDDYLMAPKNEALIIEGYIQAKQSYKEEGMTNLYVQDDDGGYFVYGLKCSKSQYDNDLVVGQKIRVEGYKDIWYDLHEVRCTNPMAKYTKLEGSKEYDALSFNYLKNETLKRLCSTKVKLTDLTVIDVAKIEPGQTDLYYQVTDGKEVLTFCVETELLPICSMEYKNALTIEVGDLIDCEGMMYVYNDAQLHTTKITKKGVNVLSKSESSMTYSEYMAAEEGSTVTIEAFIQDKQIYFEGHASIYLADNEGAYYVYELPCTREEYDNELKPGTKVKITGIRGSYNGMDEILGKHNSLTASFIVLPGKYRAPVKELSQEFNSPDLIKHVGEYVRFRNITVASKVSEYKGDLYFDVRMGNKGLTHTFCVESYLTNQATKVYKTVRDLKMGDKITCEGYLYIYKDLEHPEKIGAQLHVIDCYKLA